MGKSKFNQGVYINEYQKAHYKQYAFRFNIEKDYHIIDHLEQQQDKTSYIKRLIENDIKKQK